MSQLTPQEVSAFRSLKKTAIVLLILFRLDPRPVGPSELADILDIDRKPAAKYLDSLCKVGLVTRISYHAGYTLTTGGKQLVLGIEGDLLPAPSKQLGISSPVGNDGTGDFVPTGDFPQSATASESLSIKDLNQLQNLEAEAASKISPVEDLRYQAVFAALQGAGVGEPKRSQLCQDSQLTPEFVAGHVDKALADKVGTGMLIHRLEQHDELPMKYQPAPICTECGRPRNRHDPYCTEKLYDTQYPLEGH